MTQFLADRIVTIVAEIPSIHFVSCTSDDVLTNFHRIQGNWVKETLLDEVHAPYYDGVSEKEVVEFLLENWYGEAVKNGTLRISN